jgi:uncharacterized protein YukE
MKLKLVRFSSQQDSTSGLLFINDQFACYTLEDEQREIKVYGETAIPLGEYEIKFRTVGGFHEKYSDRFKSIHKGMLELQNVPNFQYILIHCGNTDENTAGCILIGDSQENNILMKDGFIGKSSQAYARVYPLIANELEKGNKVTIEIVDAQKKNLNLAQDYVMNISNVNDQHKEFMKEFEKVNGKLALILAKVSGLKIT